MNAVGRIGSYISRSVYTVSAPFHPFGGAVDIIVVEQQDGSFKSSPWYVRFGKFQGVLKAREKVVSISVNGVDADFSMFLDHKGEAYFLRDVDFEDVECCPSSSGEDTDGGKSQERIPGLKPKSCNFDAYESTSLTKIEMGNGKVLARTNSRRSRIMGLVFGKKPPVKVENVGEEEGDKSDNKSDSSVDRSESLERAEIAADLLDVKWSTNLASPRSKKESVSEVCSLQNVEAKDSEGSRLKHEGSDDTIDGLDESMVCNGATEQVFVETVRTNGLACEVNSEAETGFSGKEPLSIGDASKNQDAVGFPCDENATFSPHPLGNNLVSETYSQTVTLQPVYGSDGGIESQSILTISTVSSASQAQALPEQTGLQEDEHAKYEPQAKPLQGPIHVLTSEISEEEHLLFGDFDDLKFVSVGDRDEPVSPKSDKSDVKEGDSQLLNKELEENFTGKLISVSSQINIPAIKEQPDKDSRIARSLPIMSSNSYSFSANDSESLYTSHITSNENETNNHSGRTAEDEQTTEDASSTTDLATGATTSIIVPEGVKEVSKSKVNNKKLRSICPTSKQLASLNLKGGSNSIIFTFSTQMLGKQQVDARIYLWKWDTRVVISDVDGTITRSDLLGQVMPWVGVDWSHIGVTNLFSAIKENGYQLLFLSARAISQAYLTRQFLFNLKQDGKVLPEGPVVISPDGLFPSLYREVVRRAPHEFKIACLEEIKALFPADRNPFYAGFGNRDTDEISYLKVGIPKGKIFIINPKGEVVVNRRVDKKSYTSLHTLVHDMFPPAASSEQEDYNCWNYWKLPDPFEL